MGIFHVKITKTFYSDELKTDFNFGYSLSSDQKKEADKLATIQKFAKDIIENTVDLSEEQAQMINDNFWNLV